MLSTSLGEVIFIVGEECTGCDISHCPNILSPFSWKGDISRQAVGKWRETDEFGSDGDCVVCDDDRKDSCLCGYTQRVVCERLFRNDLPGS